MRRKHYVAIADALKQGVDFSAHFSDEQRRDDTLRGISVVYAEIARILKNDNERFDAGKFRKAVYGENI